MEGVHKFISLSFVLDIQNYAQALKKWFQFRKLFPKAQEKVAANAFNEYLPILKPVIYRFSQITTKASADEYAFYTALNQTQIVKIKELFEPLKKYQIVEGTPNNILSEAEVQQKFVEKPSNPITRIPLNETPSNNQLQWWYHGLAVRKTTICSTIVQGKGVGASQLGMPTANLALNEEIEKELLDFPNGIYITTFRLVEREKENQFIAVASLGTNPHYENLTNSRVVEAYVVNDFGKEKLYGERVSLQFLRLIRLEGKFLSFDSFLQAMHNDIHVGKMFSK